MRRFLVLTDPWLGDRLRGYARMLVVFGFVLLLGSIGSVLFEEFNTEAVATAWREQSLILKLIPFGVLRLSAFLARSYHHYLLAFLAIMVIFYVVAHYVRAIFNLDGVGLSVRYLAALLFAIRYPRLTVQDGEKQISPGEINLLDRIGGPGYLIVQPGSLVLLEGVDGSARVCGEGSNFVSRFEKIREVITLDDRQGFIESMFATTKDGVTIEVRDVNYAYRLRTGRVSSETARQNPDEPYPFSYRAVLNMVFGRSVRSVGITPWQELVDFAVNTAITDYIIANRFDDVTMPRFDRDVARVEIARRLNSERIRNRLRGVGAELLWVDIGHFEVVDKRVEAQRVETWGAKWAGLADVQRAFGDARRLSYLEKGRAEGQAEMLISILEVLDDVDNLVDNEDTIRAIILARTSQILDGMTERGLLTGGPADELLPPLPDR
ncbi:MAG: hypothetical protein FJ010_00990 [Chloroflexi bacterium]|nr:hypothetical protein [Chloroflexota bacterium]